jgi:hypothetical protein
MSTFKFVFNGCNGAFGLSIAALKEYNRRTNQTLTHYESTKVDRTDPVLVQIVEEMGPAASNVGAELDIEIIPIRYKGCLRLTEYDGAEGVIIDYALWLVKAIREVKDDPLLGFEQKFRAINALYVEYDRLDK